jgi:hypothetical protein
MVCPNSFHNTYLDHFPFRRLAKRKEKSIDNINTIILALQMSKINQKLRTAIKGCVVLRSYRNMPE